MKKPETNLTTVMVEPVAIPVTVEALVIDNELEAIVEPQPVPELAPKPDLFQQQTKLNTDTLTVTIDRKVKAA